MNRTYLPRIHSAVAGALGFTILLGTPLLAQADQGKWWTPKQGDQRIERRERGWQGARDQGDRRQSDRGGAWRGRPEGDRGWSDGGSRGSITYRDGRYRAGASWGGNSSWRGYPVRRDFLTIRDSHYGGYFRAQRVYCAPRHYGRVVYVRPIRYYIAAHARIGGFGIHARIVRPHYLYGCNFCDERFDDYGAYLNHVEHCDHRPGGVQISVSNWGDDYDSQWGGPYQTGDDYDQGYYNDRSRYSDDGYRDDRYDEEYDDR